MFKVKRKSTQAVRATAVSQTNVDIHQNHQEFASTFKTRKQARKTLQASSPWINTWCLLRMLRHPNVRSPNPSRIARSQTAWTLGALNRLLRESDYIKAWRLQNRETPELVVRTTLRATKLNDHSASRVNTGTICQWSQKLVNSNICFQKCDKWATVTRKWTRTTTVKADPNSLD